MMQKIHLDISEKTLPQVVYAKQFDVGRKFIVALYDSGTPYTIPESATLSVGYSATDGKNSGNFSGAVASKNTIEITIDEIMTSTAGDGVLSVTLLHENGNEISTWNIPYSIEMQPGSFPIAPSPNTVNLTKAVLFSAQNLTDAQKAQARKNIGVTASGGGGSGEDGFSPIATVTQTSDGALISITDKDGTTTATVTNGKDGVDGYTPVKGVDYFDGTDGSPGTPGADGITPHIGGNGNWFIGNTDTGKPSRGATGEAGSDGSNGKDGTSVTVKSVSESSADGGSNVVTFSDGKTVTIKNGSKGSTGSNGSNGVSATHSWNGTTLTVTSASGTSSANLKGEKGDKGDSIKGDKGDTGAAGVSISSVKQTTTSSADGGSNVVTVTLSNGTTSTFTVKNGSKGSAGANGTNGKTPVKGVDYWTEADQEAIVQQVIAALGTPVFGRVDADNNIILTGELADGTYTIKYEDAEGNMTVIGTLEQGPSYTNQIPISTDTDGSIFNGTGYKLDSRINSSGNLVNNNTLGTPKAAFATGFIPVAEGDVIRFKNCYIDAKASTTDASVYGTNANGLNVYFYKANKAAWFSVAWAIIESSDRITNLVTDANGYVTEFTFTNCAELRFARFALAGDAPNAIITVNEPID